MKKVRLCWPIKPMKDSESNPKKEIWRIRMNWLFLIICGSLYAISYTAISSSFHQFMTNPQAINLNDTNFERIEPGLGLSESFYSWVITLFNVGALIGGFGTGCLVKFIPYWYLILVSLVLHTVGYVLYAVSNEGWLIMTSKLLSGFFIGAELTLALSYFAESSIDYETAMKKLGKPVDSSETVRNNLFALHNVGVNIGYFLGPGAAAIFAQFEIDQFRSIAWYNVVFGVTFMVLQLVLFHGESTCKVARRCQLCNSKLRDFNFSAMDIFILIFLITCRGVLSFRFGAYETIYNPVLSDYFGFTERDSSYFFFGLVLAQTSGTILLLILQHFKLNTRIIAVTGLILTVLSCALMTDWQSFPYDPCTELSPFHNPEIVLNYQSSIAQLRTRDEKCLQLYQTNIEPVVYVSVKLNVGRLSPNTTGMQCDRINSCSKHCDDSIDQCLHYSFDGKLCIHKSINDAMFTSGKTDNNFLCRHGKSLNSMCITVQGSVTDHENEMSSESLHTVHSQALQLLQTDVYDIAVNKCETADIRGHHCYWTPNSIVTNRHCSDCPPICRSLQQSLTFAQFCVGAALLMVSIPVAWVPVAGLISDRVHREAQGLVMGVVVALTAIGRSISPLWLDAAYEGLKKRTFAAMILLMITHLPFLIGIIIMYKKLGAKPADSAFKDIDDDTLTSESETEIEEVKKLALSQSDSSSSEISE